MRFRYFKIEEFYCKCEECKDEKQIVDKYLIEMLDVARGIADMPFVITSGYRCTKYNEKVGGVEDSSHLTGKAADISTISSHMKYEILRSLLDVGFRRVGIYANHIHCDIDESKPQDVLWRKP
jgi:uncharacterized protein YcbK (DUF882 family)